MSGMAALQLPALHSTGGWAGTVTTIYSTAPLGTQSDILENITGQVPTASYKPTCPKLGTFRLLKAALDSVALRIKLKNKSTFSSGITTYLFHSTAPCICLVSSNGSEAGRH